MEGSGGVGVLESGGDHGHGGEEATEFADGEGAVAEGFVFPTGVVLGVGGVGKFVLGFDFDFDPEAIAEGDAMVIVHTPHADIVLVTRFGGGDEGDGDEGILTRGDFGEGVAKAAGEGEAVVANSDDTKATSPAGFAIVAHAPGFDKGGPWLNDGAAGDGDVFEPLTIAGKNFLFFFVGGDDDFNVDEVTKEGAGIVLEAPVAKHLGIHIDGGNVHGDGDFDGVAGGDSALADDFAEGKG